MENKTGEPRTIEECARLLAVIEAMMNKERTPEEDALFNLLVVLMTDYEDRRIAA